MAAPPREPGLLDARRHRRDLRAPAVALAPLPADTLLDDVLAPMRVVLGGWRIVFDERARGLRSRGPGRAAPKRAARCRTLAGNYQILAQEPRLLLPLRNPVWLQYLSHKVGRLVVPWALLGAFVSSAALAAEHWVFGLALAAQVAFYVLAGVGAWLEAQRPDRQRPVLRRAPAWRSEQQSAECMVQRAARDRLHVRDDELRRRRRAVLAAARARGLEIAMERLVFGYGTSRHKGETPETFRLQAEATGTAGAEQPPRRRCCPVRRLPPSGGRRTLTRNRDDWAFLGLMAFTALLFLRPQDIFPPLRVLHLAESRRCSRSDRSSRAVCAAGCR